MTHPAPDLLGGRTPRLLWFGLILLGGVLLLGVRLWWLQVVQSSKYGEYGDRQSMRTVRLPAARGCMYDRHGECLVENRPLYNLELYLEEVRTQSGRRGARKKKSDTLRLVSEKLQTVSQQIRHPIPVNAPAISNHMERLMPLPLVVAENLPEDALARFAARSDNLPGLGVQVASRRVYPHGSLAAHILGYVGRTAFPPGEDFTRYYYYLPDMVGREGLEAFYDAELRGRAGGRALTVDVAGYRHAEVALRLPQAGKHLHLTLDARIQSIVESALGEQVGAAVVVDPRNGDVLAMASVPAYDPNAFVPRIPRETFQELVHDPSKPFLNRALLAYEPGSTFKLITALAGLESGELTPATTAECRGVFELGQQRMRCWIASRGGAHGTVDLKGALRYSCNVFFYEHGIRIGGSAITAMARQFRLGEPTGLPVGAHVYEEENRQYRLRRVEAAGGLPAPHLFRFPGHVANLAIGQGDVRASPLQMALVAAALANGGTVWAPRLVSRIEDPNAADGEAGRMQTLAPRPRGTLAVSARSLAVIREAMRQVVEEEDGTGHRARVPGVSIAGKTGTAQFPKKDPVSGELKLIGHHVWFIGYAPMEAPRYAVAILVEEGDSGGTTCAPIAGQIFRQIFALEGREPLVARHAGGPGLETNAGGHAD